MPLERSILTGIARLVQQGLVLLKDGDRIKKVIWLRFCGAILTVDPAGSTPATPATVFNRMVPFQLGVYTDGSEMDLGAAAADQCDAASLGFNIYYEQMTCWRLKW